MLLCSLSTLHRGERQNRRNANPNRYKKKTHALGRERLDAAAVEDQTLGVARDLAGPAAVHAVILEHVGLGGGVVLFFGGRGRRG
jgi:hypothetical protein